MAKDLKSLTRQELIEIARRRKIKNPSQYTKDELRQLLMKKAKTPPGGQPVVRPRPTRTTRAPRTVAAAETSRPYYEPTYHDEPVAAPLSPVGTSQRTEAPVTFQPSGEPTLLPSSYGETRIVLLVRDPYWAHTYWDLGPQKVSEVSSLFREHWGTMRSILRIYDVTGVADFTGGTGMRAFDVDVMLEARNWYIHLGAPNRDYMVDLGLLDAQGNFYLIARSNRIRTPRDGPSEVIDEEWMDIDFEEIYALSGGYGVGASSAELRERRKKFFEHWVSSPGLFSGAVSSPVGLKKEKAKEFFLQVATELIVYGRTQAEAQVAANGEKIPLRPDGTFSLRFFLPDGEKILPIRAVSKEGDETRQAVIRVEKETSGD